MTPAPAAGGSTGSARLFDDVVRALSLALDFDEGAKLFHAWRVALLAVRLGRTLSLPDLEWLFYAGLLHDVGGIGQPDHVLHSARKGFASARSREHAAEGARILRPLSVLAPIAPLVADHHERFDGNGFPARKSGAAVPRAAYVIHAADALEVALRGGEIEPRLQVAAHTLEAQRGAAWPADVSDAALSLVQQDPDWLAGLYDDARLQDAMAAARFTPPGLERHTKSEILSQLLWVFARAIDAKHPVTVGHSHRVTRLARAVSRALGARALDDWDIVCAGLLHDVGMLGVPRAVVDRRESLTQEDLAQLRRHPLDGEAIVSSIEELRALARPAASHHERYDGSGYPWGLAGDQIPLLGQVLAFADCYDGMRAERPHRPPLSHDEAIARLRSMSGRAFDPHLADTAVDALDAAGRAWPWSDDGDDYRRLLDDDAADPTRVLPLEGKVRVMGAHGPRGALLLEIAPWIEARIGPDLALLAGRQALSALFGFDPGPELGPALDPDGARRLAGWLGREAQAEEPPLSTLVFTRSGKPLELVGRRAPGGADLLVRSAEDRLQTMKQLALFYRTFLAGAEAAFFTGRDGRLVEANRTFLELYGWTMAELTGQPPPLFGPAPARSFAQLCALAESSAGAAFHGEVETFRRDGAGVPALFTVVAVKDAAGAPLGYVGRCVDISERKRLEAELARKNEELEALSRLKSDLIAITSHDLKSPLAGMMAYADLVKKRLAEGRVDSVPEYVDRMTALGDRMLRLVHDILSLRKIESGTFKLDRRPTRAGELLRRCAEVHASAAQEKGVRLLVELRGERLDAPALLDPDRLDQVLDNLVANALRFAPAGSEVTLSAEHVGPSLRLAVSDRGPGIPEAELELVFDRYHQVKRTQPGVSARSYNVGLGLAIARSIVELHDGTLSAANRDGGGCSFVVELPAAAEAAAPRRPVALVIDPSGALADQLAPSLGLRTEVQRAADLAEAARLAKRARPAVVFASGGAAGPEALAFLDTLAGPDGQRPPLVEVTSGDGLASGLADRVLSMPVLDVEVLELVRELSGVSR